MQLHLNLEHNIFRVVHCFKQIVESPSHRARVVGLAHHGVGLAGAGGAVGEDSGVVAGQDVVHEVAGGVAVDLLLAAVCPEHHVKHVLSLVIATLPKMVNFFGFCRSQQHHLHGKKCAKYISFLFEYL